MKFHGPENINPRVRLARCLAGGFIAALVALFWLQNRHLETPAPVPAVTAPPPQGSLWSRTAAARPQPTPSQPGVDITSLIQEKLLAWGRAPDPRVAAEAMQELLALVTDQNVVEIIQSLPAENLNGPFGNALLERWLALDPNTAAAWLAARPDATGEQTALVARKLLEDRGGFQNYLERLPDGEWKEKVLGAAGFEVASDDPIQAIEFAKRMNPGETRTGLLQSAAFEWARREPAAAMQWLNQVDDPALREPLIAWGAKGYATADPREAAEWLIASVKGGDLLNETATSIVRSWAASEPAAAADWVVRFPESPVRDEALETLMSFWAASDSGPATAWVEKLPAGSFRQKAAAILARLDSGASQ
jgi:hypothetical protein